MPAPSFARPTVLTGHTAAVYALAPWRGGVLSGGGEGMVAHWAAPYDGDGRLVAQIDDRVFCLATLTGAQDGQIVAGTLSGDLYWIDVAARTPPRRWQLHRDGLFGLCTAGAHLFAVGGGGQLSRWRLADGTFEDAAAVDTVRLRSVAYLPVAGLLVVGTAAGDLHLVAPDSLRTVDVYERAHDSTVFDIAAYAPDACYTCGRDGAIRAWQWRGGAFRQNLHVAAHGATVNALALAPRTDGEGARAGFLASAGRDREVRLWRAGPGELVLAKALTGPRDGGHAHSVNACCYAADGVLVTAGDDRTVRVWRPQANKRGAGAS